MGSRKGLHQGRKTDTKSKTDEASPTLLLWSGVGEDKHQNGNSLCICVTGCAPHRKTSLVNGDHVSFSHRPSRSLLRSTPSPLKLPPNACEVDRSQTSTVVTRIVPPLLSNRENIFAYVRVFSAASHLSPTTNLMYRGDAHNDSSSLSIPMRLSRFRTCARRA